MMHVGHLVLFILNATEIECSNAGFRKLIRLQTFGLIYAKIVSENANKQHATIFCSSKSSQYLMAKQLIYSVQYD